MIKYFKYFFMLSVLVGLAFIFIKISLPDSDVNLDDVRPEQRDAVSNFVSEKIIEGRSGRFRRNLWRIFGNMDPEYEFHTLDDGSFYFSILEGDPFESGVYQVTYKIEFYDGNIVTRSALINK